MTLVSCGPGSNPWPPVPVLGADTLQTELSGTVAGKADENLQYIPKTFLSELDKTVHLCICHPFFQIRTSKWFPRFYNILPWSSIPVLPHPLPVRPTTHRLGRHSLEPASGTALHHRTAISWRQRGRLEHSPGGNDLSRMTISLITFLVVFWKHHYISQPIVIQFIITEIILFCFMACQDYFTHFEPSQL